MRFALGLALTAALACGGKQPAGLAPVAGPAGRSDVQGTLGPSVRQSFAATDAISYVSNDPTGNSFLRVWITSFPQACGLAMQNAGVREGVVLVVNLSTLDEGNGKRSAATQPGEYKFGQSAGGRSAQAAALHTDKDCRAAPLAVGGASGSVTVASIGPSGASGTFDLTFAASGDHLSGAFEAVACSAAPFAAYSPATLCR